MKTLLIDSRDLPYTIDTYAMFNGDSADEMERENYREDYGLTDDEWRELGFDYDHSGIVRDLADASVNILTDELVGAFDYGKPDANGIRPKVEHGIILAISQPVETRSPQFYNYTTDSYRANWTIDDDKLRQYVADRWTDFQAFAAEEWRQSDRNWMFSGLTADALTDDDDIAAMLDFYVRDVLTVDDYNMAMWERESEVYVEHMNLDTESAALIATKEKVES